MLTAAAARADAIARLVGPVTTFPHLRTVGTGPRETAGHVAARRWQRFGRAVVTHNGAIGLADRRAICLANAGPRALLTSFTSLECAGLVNWHRDETHLLVPAGADVRRVSGFPVVVHRVTDWSRTWKVRGQPWHAHPDAAVVAAASMSRERFGIGLFAAAVQQDIVRVDAVHDVVERTSNLRHRRGFLLALGDIAMGAQALSEIDFGRLCQRAGLVAPDRQAVRVEPNGRRRYLDAEWRRPDGRRVVAEVDGAIHLRADRWWADQARQNEIVLTDAIVLRYPAPVVRAGDPVIVDQLRRAGVPRRHQ